MSDLPLHMQRQFADLSVHLLPQLGYLIQVEPGDVEVMQYPEGWELQVSLTKIPSSHSPLCAFIQFHDDDGKQYFKVRIFNSVDYQRH